jgi:RimJ/RimL family protein N-acetyltransferase
MTNGIRLRKMIDADFPIFFAMQRDAESSRMAAFGTKDPDAASLAARWQKAASDGSTTQQAVLCGSAVVGFVATFRSDGKLQVTYWIARSHWGRGIASAALTSLLELVPTRPLYASAAKDNVGSLRVLEKCGFTVCGSERAFAGARGEEIDEILLALA